MDRLTDFGSWYLMLLGGLSIVIILVDRRGPWGLIRRFLLPADLIPTAHRSKPVAEASFIASL
jgi:branched-chain amino acid transport system permease protein